MKSYKNLIILLVVIVVIIIIAAFIKKSRAKKAAFTEPTPETIPIVGQGAFSGVVSFPLKSGSKGREVKLLQLGLNKWHGAGLNVDGDFGPKTLAALKSKFNISAVPKDYYNTLIGRYENELLTYAAINGINV